MLELTDNAIEAVKEIIASSTHGGDVGGVRIVADEAGRDVNFRLDVVPLPAEDDEVIEEENARVFLDPTAAAFLNDKVLDASIDDNQVAFTIRSR